MARGVPVQPKTRTKIIALIRQEVARNEIARRCGVSTATVSRIARAEGLTFDRSQTKAATAAQTVDLTAARLRLAEKMTARAERMLDDLDGEYLVYNFGGKDNTYNERVLAKPPVEVQRNAVTTAGIAFDKLTRIIEKSDETDGLAPVESMLGRLATRFGLVEATDE